MSADDQLQGTDQRHLPARSDLRPSHQPPDRSNDYDTPDTADEWEGREEWLASSEVAVDTAGDPAPDSPPPDARRRRRTEWWLLAPLTLALLAIFQLVLAQRGNRDAVVVLETKPEAVSIQPTAAPITSPAPVPKPSIRYSANRLAQVAGGTLGTAPIGVTPGVPELDAQAAVLVDIDRREALYVKNHHMSRPMASTVKIVTAIVALEHAPLSTIIEVDATAAAMEPNVMGLKAGERLTLEELLYGLMLDSGNDAAEAIARGVFGDRARFIRLMNDLVTKLGLQNTHFANPSGLDDPAQRSSAYDLAVLTTYALQNPVFREIVGTRRKVIPASGEPGREHGWFGPTNLNRLIGSYPGAFGVKPGWTGDAGYTLVAAAERGGRSLLAVVLGSRNHFTDAERLLNYGFTTPAG